MDLLKATIVATERSNEPYMIATERRNEPHMIATKRRNDPYIIDNSSGSTQLSGSNNSKFISFFKLIGLVVNFRITE